MNTHKYFILNLHKVISGVPSTELDGLWKSFYLTWTTEGAPSSQGSLL